MTIAYVFEGRLYVNLTNRCPNHCDFCLRNNVDGVGDANNLWLEKEPNRDEIFSAIVSKGLENFPEIVFCGYGEPTCRLEDMLFVCRKIREISNIKIRVNTNGLSNLINNRETAQDFKGLVDTLSISLNAPNAQRYDEICHSEFGANAFGAVLEFAKSAKDFVPNVILSIVDKDLSRDEIENCKDLCDKIGVNLKIRKYID